MEFLRVPCATEWVGQVTYDRAIEALVAHRADLLEQLGAELLSVSLNPASDRRKCIADMEFQLACLDEMLSSEPRARAIVQSVIERIAK